MKFKFKLISAVFFILVCACVNFGQDEPVTGGYAETSVSNAEVVKAAKFAIKKRSSQQKNLSLTAIKQAELQVVAGINYRLCLQITFKDKKSKKIIEQFVMAIIYRNLKNSYSLTSWTEGCGDSIKS
ncbi:MAG TPA: cystatin domain-containing protein [Pyrinomonadaceae bacterium]|nr:cystatin domain-containing protein [Pyrinomonadaceae bacterium]